MDSKLVSSSAKLVFVVLFATLLLDGVICSNLSAKARHGTHWNRIGKRFYESLASAAAANSNNGNDNIDENRSAEITPSDSFYSSPSSSLNYDKDVVDSLQDVVVVDAGDESLSGAKRDTDSYFNNYLTGKLKKFFINFLYHLFFSN